MVEYGGEDEVLVYHEEAEEGDEFDRCGMPPHVPNLSCHTARYRMMEERKKRRNKGLMSDMEAREYVENLLTRLDTAHDIDKEARKAKRPAIAKLKALPVFEEAVARPHLHRYLFDAGILKVFTSWLYPHEDATLPNIKLRTALLKMLVRINIDTSLEHRRDQLKQSNLGKIVMFYSRLPDETAGNRKLAAQLVEHWSKPVYEQFARRDSDAARHEEAARMRELKRKQAKKEEARIEQRREDEPRPGERGFRCVKVLSRWRRHAVHANKGCAAACCMLLAMCSIPL